MEFRKSLTINDLRSKVGVSLAELMVSMFLFLLVSLGITAMVIQSQKISQSNVTRNAAHTVVQGYLEQVKSMTMTDILAAVGDPVNVPLATVKLSATAASNFEVNDDLFLNVENSKTILLDLVDEGGGSFREILLNLFITPTVNDLSDVATYGSDAVPAVEIIMDFEYESNHLGAGTRRSGSLRLVKSDIEE